MEVWLRISQVVLWGFAATLVLTLVMRGSQAAGLTRMDLPLVLGLMLTPDREHAKILGVLGHVLIGWLVAFLYSAYFSLLGGPSWQWGGLLGLIHGLVVLMVVLPALPGIHPRMASDATGPEPTRNLQPPGFLGLNYGRQTAVVTLVAHVLYGVLLGLALGL
jgi:hypothetical protein